jgi:hypothetical protein
VDELKQFKCLTDLNSVISEISSFKARPVARGEHPTIYSETSDGKYKTVMGVRVCDYKFSADLQWVLPDEQMGLSFSSTWQNLKSVYKLVSRGKTKPVDVYWVLSGADIPSGMAFIQDRKPSNSAKGHYYLTVTEKMKVSTLVEKLKLIAHHMTVIRSAGNIL